MTKTPSKFTDLLLFLTVAFMFISVCAEADMYVPSFPDMVKYFGIGEDTIQLTLSLNFIGLCIAGLITGPLSDVYGCRKVLIIGLLLLALSTIGCIFAESFPTLIFWRILQGATASVPMVVGGAVFLHTYPAEKAGKMVGLVNGVICSAMAAAPIFGTLLNSYFNWRANFVAILVLVIVSLIGVYYSVDDKNQVKTNKLNLKKISHDYLTIIKSFKFFAYMLIVLLPFVSIVLYIANLSLICINHLKIEPKLFAFYQAATATAFVIASITSAKIISIKGINFTKHLGLILTTIGGFMLFITALYDYTAINMICISMAILASGSAMLPGTFAMEALDLFPKIKGAASGMLTTYRQILAAGLIFLSEIFFDGTIVPVATIIFVFLIACLLLYFISNTYLFKVTELSMSTKKGKKARYRGQAAV